MRYFAQCTKYPCGHYPSVWICIDDLQKTQYQTIFTDKHFTCKLHFCISRENPVCYKDESVIHIHNSIRYINWAPNRTINFNALYTFSHTSCILYSHLVSFFSFWSWLKHYTPFKDSFLTTLCFCKYESLWRQDFRKKQLSLKTKETVHTCRDCRVFTPKWHYISKYIVFIKRAWTIHKMSLKHSKN